MENERGIEPHVVLELCPVRLSQNMSRNIATECPSVMVVALRTSGDLVTVLGYCTADQLASGSKAVSDSATCAVCGPRSFWKRSPS